MKVLIGGAGKQHGKSTVNNIFIEAGFTAFSFATTLKLCIAPLLIGLGIEDSGEYLYGSKKDVPLPNFDGVTTGRDLLIEFGTHVIRAKDPNAWLKCEQQKYDADPNPQKMYCGDDLRFQNEFDWADITIWVEDPRKPVLQNSTEGLLDRNKFDYIIVNDGTLADLRIKVLKVIEKIAVDYRLNVHNRIQLELLNLAN